MAPHGRERRQIVKFSRFYDGELLGRPHCQKCSKRFAADFSFTNIKCPNCGTDHKVVMEQSENVPAFSITIVKSSIKDVIDYGHLGWTDNPALEGEK